jgi:hypothetical protein
LFVLRFGLIAQKVWPLNDQVSVYFNMIKEKRKYVRTIRGRGLPPATASIWEA